MVDGKREVRTFESKDDVWEVIDLIIEETNQANQEKGMDFDIAKSVVSQIPFFACKSIFFDRDIQRDIQRYIYCEKFGVSPYNGSYGEQPFNWVQRAFAINSALAKKEKREIDGSTK